VEWPHQESPRSSPPAPSRKRLLTVRGMKKHFKLKSPGFFGGSTQILKAVDGVDLDLDMGETLGLVGESGCGKTTLGRLIIRLIQPTDGSVQLYDSENLVNIPARKMLPYRRRMQMIFQDPYSSLNPRMTVGSIVGEALKIHRLASGNRKERISELLVDCGLAADIAQRFPHELSGGQRQRVGIARALAVEPKLIIADEPVSALDVSIQAQVINLLQELRERHHLSFLFISHDLSVVGHISHRVAVMYLGKLVEIGPTRDVFSSPAHPYTEALLNAIPRMKPETSRRRIVLEGDVPSPINPPPGCPFHTRCPKSMDHCRQVVPKLKKMGAERSVACLLYD
jgi:oligopeptide transport system ATP-binding protein